MSRKWWSAGQIHNDNDNDETTCDGVGNGAANDDGEGTEGGEDLIATQKKVDAFFSDRILSARKRRTTVPRRWLSGSSNSRRIANGR